MLQDYMLYISFCVRYNRTHMFSNLKPISLHGDGCLMYVRCYT